MHVRRFESAGIVLEKGPSNKAGQNNAISGGFSVRLREACKGPKPTVRAIIQLWPKLHGLFCIYRHMFGKGELQNLPTLVTTWRKGKVTQMMCSL